MVIVILTRAGFVDVRERLIALRCPVWTNGGVLSATEVKELRDEGIDLSVFSGKFDPANNESLEAMLDTVELHHPEDCLWVELRTSAAQS